MSLFTSLFNFIFSDWLTFLTCTCIGVLTYSLSKFYHRVWSLPRGPMPWPLIGNALLLNRKENGFITINKLHKTYGPIFTFWTGTLPMVIINDLNIGKEAFKKSEFSGRLQNGFSRAMRGPNNDRSDIACDDFGPRWESNRKVALAAVRKYSVSERLAELVADVTDETIKEMLKRENISKPFDPQKYVLWIFHNILASSAFGKRYPFDDPELNEVQENFKKLQDPMAIFIDFVPGLKYIFRKKLLGYILIFNEFIDFIKSKFIVHYNDYDSQNIKNFSDSLIFAKNEALAEGKETAPYLTDDNLALAIFDLFTAGSDTSQFTMRWMIYFMANYPDIQRKLREEIATHIGTRIPVQEDKNNLNYVNAFITEALRHRPIAPLGLGHETVVDTKLGDYQIPKQTTVMVNLFSIQHQEQYFPDPDTFNPSRFLDASGRFLDSQKPGLVPFSVGRRSCLGEKLAMADLFLVLVRFLQLTQDFEIALPDGPGSGDMEPDAAVLGLGRPKDYKIKLVKKNLS